jgi:hypothetical protein
MNLKDVANGAKQKKRALEGRNRANSGGEGWRSAREVQKRREAKKKGWRTRMLEGTKGQLVEVRGVLQKRVMDGTNGTNCRRR